MSRLITPAWEDAMHAVVRVGDWPVGLPRSKTRETVGEAIKAEIHPSLPPVGPLSVDRFVRVYLADLLRVNAALSVGGNKRVPPKRIPDWPDRCAICGKGILQLFTSIDHEGGPCPG